MEISMEKEKQVADVHFKFNFITDFTVLVWRLSFCFCKGFGTMLLLYKGNLSQGGVVSWRE